MAVLDELAALAKREPVEGTPYFVRVMTGKDWCEWRAFVSGRPETDEIQLIDYAQLLVRTLCNDKGERILANEDAQAVADGTDPKTILSTYSKALTLNCFAEVVAEEKKDSAPTAN